MLPLLPALITETSIGLPVSQADTIFASYRTAPPPLPPRPTTITRRFAISPTRETPPCPALKMPHPLSNKNPMPTDQHYHYRQT
jgi:hypothetical protein